MVSAPSASHTTSMLSKPHDVNNRCSHCTCAGHAEPEFTANSFAPYFSTHSKVGVGGVEVGVLVAVLVGVDVMVVVWELEGEVVADVVAVVVVGEVLGVEVRLVVADVDGEVEAVVVTVEVRLVVGEVEGEVVADVVAVVVGGGNRARSEATSLPRFRHRVQRRRCGIAVRSIKQERPKRTSNVFCIAKRGSSELSQQNVQVGSCCRTIAVVHQHRFTRHILAFQGDTAPAASGNHLTDDSGLRCTVVPACSVDECGDPRTASESGCKCCGGGR